jgi:hypothetical protein
MSQEGMVNFLVSEIINGMRESLLEIKNIERVGLEIGFDLFFIFLIWTSKRQ